MDEVELIGGEGAAFTVAEADAWRDLEAFVAGALSAPTREGALEAYATLGAWLTRIKSEPGADEEPAAGECGEV